MLRLLYALAGTSAVLFCSSLTAATMGENLCPPASATHIAIASGSWQEKTTWSRGVIPSTNARVLIPAGITVTNHATTADVLWIHVAGTLKVCDHCDTQINVHTVYIPMGGSMQLGMPTMPCTGMGASSLATASTAIQTTSASMPSALTNAASASARA